MFSTLWHNECGKGKNAAFAMVVGAHDKHEVLQRDDDDE